MPGIHMLQAGLGAVPSRSAAGGRLARPGQRTLVLRRLAGAGGGRRLPGGAPGGRGAFRVVRTGAASGSIRGHHHHHAAPSDHLAGGFLGLDDLVAAGASLFPVPEPHMLLRPSSKWRLSTQIRSAVEGAIRAGIEVAVVRMPHLAAGQTGTPTGAGRLAEALAADWAAAQAWEGGDAAAAVDADAPPSVALSYQAGDTSYLLLLQQPVASPQGAALEAAVLEERRGSHAGASSSSAAAAAAAAMERMIAAAEQPLQGIASTPARAGVEPGKLTNQIRWCKDAGSLVALLQQHWAALDHIHVSTAFVQLAHIRQGRAARTGSRQQQQQHHHHHHAAAGAPEAGASSASGSAAAAVAASLDPAFAQQLLQLAHGQLGRMQSRCISNILWSTAVLGLRPGGAWIAAFAGAAEQHFARGTAPQGFANTLWALATLRWRPEQAWMRSFFAASQPQLASCNTQELSNMLWALGSLKQAPPPHWLQPALAASAAQMAAATPQALANQAWALAVLKQQPGDAWLLSLLYASELQAKQFSSQTASLLLWAMGMQLGSTARDWQHAPALSAWRDAMVAAAGTRLRQSSAHALSNAVWGMAVLGSQPSGAFMAAWEAAAARQLRDFSVADMACALWALSRMQWLPSAGLLGSCLQHLEGRLRSARPRALAQLIQALGSFTQQQEAAAAQDGQHQPPPPGLVSDAWLQAFLEAAELQLQYSPPRVLCSIGTGLAALRRPPPPFWQAQYLQAVALQLGAFQPGEHALLLQALAGFRAEPHSGWCAAFCASIITQLPAHSAQQLAGLVGGLAAAGVQPVEQQLQGMLRRWQRLQAAASGADTAQLIQGLAGLGYRPANDWMCEWHKATAPQLASWQAADAAAVLSALTRLQLRPQPKWAYALQQSMLQQQLAGQVETGTAVELMWACAAARRPPAPRQLAAMVLQLTDALPDMGIGTFSRALWAASSLGGLQHPQQAEAVALSGQAAEVAAAAAAAAGGGCGCGSTTPRDLWLQHAFSDASAAALAGAGGNTLATLAHSLLLLQAPAPPAAWAAAYGAALGACAAELSIKQLQHVLAFLPALPSGPAAARLPQQLLAAAQQLLPVCNAPELAQLADGASLLAGAPPAGWAEAVTAAAARHADAMPADSAAQLLRALARSGASPPRHLLASLAAGTQAKLARAAPAARVELLLAFQHLSFRPAAAWVAALTGSFQAGSLQRLPGCQLAALGVGLARAGHAPGGAWMPAYLEAMGGKLQHLTPDRLADVAWALAVLDERPGKQFLDSFQAESRAQLEAFGGAALARMVWGLATLGQKPKQEWLDRFMGLALRRLEDLQAPQLAQMLWSLAALDCRPAADWMVAFVEQAKCKVPGLTAETLAEVMWALDRLDASSDKALLRSFAAEARAHLVAPAGQLPAYLPTAAWVAPSTAEAAAGGGGSSTSSSTDHVSSVPGSSAGDGMQPGSGSSGGSRTSSIRVVVTHTRHPGVSGSGSCGISSTSTLVQHIDGSGAGHMQLQPLLRRPAHPRAQPAAT